MGLILDSSVIIAAEHRGDTGEDFLSHMIAVATNQDVALSPDLVLVPLVS